MTCTPHRFIDHQLPRTNVRDADLFGLQLDHGAELQWLTPVLEELQTARDAHDDRRAIDTENPAATLRGIVS